jgi:hypothetical protein
MADLISEIVAPEALEQLRESKQLLKDNFDELQKVIDSARKMSDSFKGVKDFKGLNDVVKQQEDIAKKLTDTENKYTEAVFTAAQKRQRAVEIANARMEAIERRRVDDAVKQAKRKADAEEREIIRILKAEDKATAAKLKKAQQEEKILDKMIANEEKANQKKELIRQKQERQLEIQSAKERAALLKAAANAEKAAAIEEKALSKLNNEYEQLKKKYAAAANEAKRLGIAMGTNSEEFINASKSAKGMYEQLLKVELAVGQGQRQVGQYNQVAVGLQQTLREMPAFANSFQTGLMAISNNLPTLLDGLKQLKEKNKEIVASGGEAVSVWDTMKDALSDLGTISALAITALTFLAAKFKFFDEEISESEEQIKSYNKALLDINKDFATSLANEELKIKQLLKTATNLKLSYDIRTDAIKKLRSENRGLLADLTNEEIMTTKTAEAAERLSKAVYQKYLAESFGRKAALAMDKKIALTTETMLEDGTIQQAPISKAAQDVDKAEKNLARIKALLAEEKKNQKFYQDIDETEGLVKAESILANAKKNYEELNNQLADAQKAINKFSDAQNNALNELMGMGRSGTNDDTTKPDKIKREFIKAEDDLMKAIFDREKQRLEIEKTTQKEISDNTEAELSDRLIAYQRYMAAVIQILQMEKDLTIDIEQAKINELESRKKGASKIEIANLVNDQKAAYARMMSAAERFNADLAQVEADGRKEIFDITKSSNAEWLNNEQLAYAQMKQLDAAALMTTEQLLRHDYDKKLISRRKYNQELSKLQLMAHKMELDNEIKHLENLLNSDKLTAEKRLELANQLANAKRNRAMAEKGIQSKSANRRPTDSLAMMLGTPEEGKEEQYLQAFYDNTVDLANKAADAIIAANQRRFQAEKDQLDRQAAQYKAYYERQSQFIKDTVQDETERNKQLAQLDAQRAGKEAEIEAKKRDIAIRQARFEKAAAIASITQNTAVAISKATAQFTIAAPPIVALIAAAGAIQLAAAASTPIPQYRTGTDYHVGGAFIAGDGGEHELIVAPNKAPYLSNNTSTLYNEVAGTKVIPLSKISNYAGSDNMSLDIAGQIVNGFDRTGKKLAGVIMASKPNINMDAMAEQMRRERNLQGK